MSKDNKRFIKQVVPIKVWRKLGLNLREAWNYMWMNCDESGVYTIDEDLFEFNNQYEFPKSELKEKLKDWLIFNEDKILIKAFIETNYGGQLKKEYNPHKPVFRAIVKNNLKLKPSLNQAYFKLVDEEEDEDEEEEVNFEKSEKLLTDFNNLKNQIENEFTWKETVFRNTKDVKPDFKFYDLEKYLVQFFKQLENDGDTEKTIKDFKKHFSRWLNLEIKNDHKKNKKSLTFETNR